MITWLFLVVIVLILASIDSKLHKIRKDIVLIAERERADPRISKTDIPV